MKGLGNVAQMAIRGPQLYDNPMYFGRIGAFLIGGFIIGWKSGQRRVFDSVIAAAITVGLSFVVYLLIPQGYKAQFITGALLSDPAQAVTWGPTGAGT